MKPLFSIEEIKEVVWFSDCDKSPGPNGFPLGFLKRCWSFVSQEVVAFVRDFHARGKLPKAITASFVLMTLGPFFRWGAYIG